MKYILIDYIEGRSSREIVNYITKRLDRFTNPKYSAIAQLVGLFNRDWAKKLENDFDSRYKTTINSVVNLRNQLAHGENTPVSLPQIREYYADVKRFVALLHDVINESS